MAYIVSFGDAVDFVPPSRSFPENVTLEFSIERGIFDDSF